MPARRFFSASSARVRASCFSLRISASNASLLSWTWAVPGRTSLTVTIWPITSGPGRAASWRRMAARTASTSSAESASTMVGWGQRPNSAFWLASNWRVVSDWGMRAFSRRKSYSNGWAVKCNRPKIDTTDTTADASSRAPGRRTSRRPSGARLSGAWRDRAPSDRRSPTTIIAGSTVKVAIQQHSTPIAPITPNW